MVQNVECSHTPLRVEPFCNDQFFLFKQVQQLIAGSPDLLFEDAAFLGKSFPDGSTPKKLPIEYVVKSRLQKS
jgi:hypothetical protein